MKNCLNEKIIKMKNGFFDNETREYVITDMYPRRPLMNYLWNEEMVCACDHFGNGQSWRSLGATRRQIEAGERNVYIKDKTTQKFYSANRNHRQLPFDVFETHVGLGYHTVISEYKGVQTEFSIVVPSKGTAILFRIQIKNVSAENKNLGMYFTIQPNPDLTGHTATGYADYSAELDGLVYHHDGFRAPNTYTKIFVGSNQKCVGYELSGGRFKGIYSGYHNPISLYSEKLSCKGTTFEAEYIAALQFDVALQPGEKYENTICAFAAQNENECKQYKEKYLTENCFETEKEMQQKQNAESVDVLTLHSPDAYLNSQVNFWLKRQLSLGKTWGRLYGKGFRDVMQDISAFVSFDKELARKRILYALKFQYEDGNPIRMFEPNFHYPYNDGGAWITGAILAYLQESGDLSILEETLPYLKGDSYASACLADVTVTEEYVAGERRDNVLEHVRAAIDYLLSCEGEHGLVLWRGGDWNDSMNSTGLQGKGESVWLSIATIKAVAEFQEILSLLGNADEDIKLYEQKKENLKNAVEKHGFNGKHYIYGINDQGDRIGDNDRIFLNPQTWAVLGQVGDRARLVSVMEEVEERLKCPFGYVQCNPSFIKGDPNIGRVSYFQKGLIENGAVYNHGVAFKIAADCMLGRGEQAYRSLKLISCDNVDNLESGVEPYAVSNMYIGPENPYYPGYAPMSWITGTAGWLYRCVTEFICGVKPSFYALKIKPCLPSGWSGTRVVRKFRDNIYDITFEESDEDCLICDGVEVEELPLQNKNEAYIVVCRYKRSEKET